MAVPFDFGSSLDAYKKATTEPAFDPAKELADLLNKDLGTNVPAGAMRLFILGRWSRVTAFAHAIHDNEVAADKKIAGAVDG